MSENKKRYNKFGLRKVGNTDVIYGKMEGRVNNAGLKDASFTGNNGEEVKRIRFYLSVPNRTEAIAKTLGIDKSVLNPQMDKTNTNEYVSVPVTVADRFQYDWLMGNLKAGDIVQVTGELTKREYNGKTYINFITYMSVDKVYTGTPSNTTATGTVEPEKPEEAKTAPASKTEAKPAPKAVEPVVEDDFDSLEFEDDDLPF